MSQYFFLWSNQFLDSMSNAQYHAVFKVASNCHQTDREPVRWKSSIHWYGRVTSGIKWGRVEKRIVTAVCTSIACAHSKHSGNSTNQNSLQLTALTYTLYLCSVDYSPDTSTRLEVGSFGALNFIVGIISTSTVFRASSYACRSTRARFWPRIYGTAPRFSYCCINTTAQSMRWATK